MTITQAEFYGASTATAECLRNLIMTPVGTCGMNRDFGLDWSFLDLPTEAAKAAYSAELIEKVERFIPSVRVKEITWSAAGETLKPRVVIEYV